MCKGTNKRAKNKRKTKVFLFISEWKHFRGSSSRNVAFADIARLNVGNIFTRFWRWRVKMKGEAAQNVQRPTVKIKTYSVTIANDLSEDCQLRTLNRPMKWAKIGRKAPLFCPFSLLRSGVWFCKSLSMKFMQKSRKMQPSWPSARKKAVFLNQGCRKCEKYLQKGKRRHTCFLLQVCRRQTLWRFSIGRVLVRTSRDRCASSSRCGLLRFRSIRRDTASCRGSHAVGHSAGRGSRPCLSLSNRDEA